MTGLVNPPRGHGLARLARRPFRTIRPTDAADVYAHPRQQLAKQAANGELLRVATGYYVVVPRALQGRPWVPQLEAVAAGIGTAEFGPESAVLMGISAARMHGAIPRALGVAVLAVPRQRRRLALADRAADVIFVKRDTERLDAVRVDTELGPALVTSVEQTILDIAHRPGLGDAKDEAMVSIRLLLARADRGRMELIASKQRLAAAQRRALHAAER